MLCGIGQGVEVEITNWVREIHTYSTLDKPATKDGVSKSSGKSNDGKSNDLMETDSLKVDDLPFYHDPDYNPLSDEEFEWDYNSEDEEGEWTVDVGWLLKEETDENTTNMDTK